MIAKDKFLGKYKISNETFSSTGLSWDLLEEIFCNYSGQSSQFLAAANLISDYLRQIHEVHSLKFRIKDPEHLIEKIVRKKIEDPSRDITLETYRVEITDLIGVRALHLFKDEWSHIHQAVTSTWDLHETPKAYIRSGDSEQSFKENGCEINHHVAGYRSVHYLVKSQPAKFLFIAELQVRTIFEEGWSEIDHKLRYPHDLDNEILAEYLAIFNRLAGSADEMGTHIQRLKTRLVELEGEVMSREQERQKTLIDLESLKVKLQSEAADKKKLQEAIDSISKYPILSPLVLSPLGTIFQNSDLYAKPSEYLISSLGAFAGDKTCKYCGKRYSSSSSRPLTASLVSTERCPHCQVLQV